MSEYSRTRFQIDSLAGKQYEGFSDQSFWNGFARPLFEYEVAVEVLRDSEANGFEWEYELESDTFVVSYSLQPDDDPEEFGGQTIQVGTEEKRVYGIGAGSWIWDLAEEE